MSAGSTHRSRVARIVLVALAFVCAALIALGAAHEPNTTIPRGLAGRHVRVHGTPIRVVQRGRGRDVLLIHGSPGSVEDWATIDDELATRFRVTSFDRPGHGFSGDVGQYSYVFNAEVARELIDALGLEHVIVVGHSYGGTTALAMALDAPATGDPIDGYVVVDSSTYRSARKATLLYRALDVPYLGVGLARVLPGSIADGKIRAGLSDQFRRSPPSESFLRMRVRLWSVPKVTHAIAEETLGTDGWLRALSRRYRQITAPVAIVGQADDAFRSNSLRRLHRDVRGSTLTLLPDTGHYVQFERPRDVIEAIDAMHARVPVPVPVP